MMKKILWIITLACLSILTYGQSERVFNSNMKISKVAPRFTLSGLGATILMDGATSGTTTLRPYAAAGGTIVIPQSASTDTLQTNAGVRLIYAPKANPTFTGTVHLPSITVGNTADTVKIDSIILDGNVIKVYRGSDVSALHLATNSEYNGVRLDSVFVSFTGADLDVNIGAHNLITIGIIETGKLGLGNSASTNYFIIDSLTKTATTFKLYDGATQLAPDIPVGGYDELSDYAVMVDDTLHSNGQYFTQWQVDSLMNVYGDIIRVSFKIDSTLYAPETDDSLYTDSRFIGKDVKVWRGGATASLGRLYEQSWVDDTNVGYEFNNTTGLITFHPKFTTGEKIIIEATDTIIWTTNLDPYYLLRSDEYATVYNAMTNPPTGDTIFWQDDMVYSLDSLTVWDRMDVFYVFANHNETDAQINWENPGTHIISQVNDVTWTQWQGFKGDGSADYLTTNYNPCSDSVNFGKNDCSIGIYLRVDQARDDDYVYGAVDANYKIEIEQRDAGDNLSAALNTTSTYQSMTGTMSGCSGLLINTRRLPTGVGAIEMYRNGNSIDTETDASTGVPNQQFGILVRYSASPSKFSSNEVAIFFISNAISDDEATAINTIIERYMDRIGKGVE